MQAILDSLKFEPLIFVMQLVLFLVLWTVLAQTFWKPHLANLNARDQRVTDAHVQQQKLQSDMENLRNEYLTRINLIEADARQQIATAVKAAQDERERIVREARERAESTLQQGHLDLEREKSEAIVTSQGQIVTLATDAAGKMLGSVADPATLRATIEKRVMTGIALTPKPENN